VHEQGERYVLRTSPSLRARLAIACGDEDEARRHLETAVATAAEMGIAPVAGLADELARSGGSSRRGGGDRDA
jgi:hypothetical protein